MMHEILLAMALDLIRLPATQTIVVDGRVDEPAWQKIPASEEFYQVLPQPGATPAYKTSLRVAQDPENLYLAIILEDPPGGARRSNSSRHDHIPGSDDILSITVDPVGTRAFGQVFQVNPDCSTNDGFYKEASLSTDLSADFVYEVACQQMEHSWSVEYKIPLRELRFVGDQSRGWNLLVQRSLVRDQLQTVANAPLPRDPLCQLCLAPTLTSGGAPLPKPQFLRLIPYALARHTERDRTATGLDVKYRFSAESIVDATINPDFSQVSLDEPQLSANTLFAVSSPENRPFFLEGADILDTPLKLVATRSVTQPSWGLKYTRRSTSSDSMLLFGDDRSDNRILLPGPYASRFRAVDARQKFIIGSTHIKGERTALGLSFTQRSYEELGANQTAGVDALHYISDADSLRWQSILSLSSNSWNADTEKFERVTPTSGSAHYLLLQHKGPLWQNSLELKSFTDAFRSDLGFNPRSGYRLGILTNSYQQPLGTQQLNTYLRLSKKTEQGPRPIQDQWAPGVTLTGVLGGSINLETRPQTLERIRPDSRLHAYRQHYASFSLYPDTVLSALECSLTWGERLDVKDDRVRPGRVESCSLRLAPFKKLELNSSFSQERLLQHSWHEQQNPILSNWVLRHLLVIPLQPRLAFRYLRQEERAKRVDSPASTTSIDSWNLSYENPEGLSAYTGATLARETGSSGSTQKDYYLKLSWVVPGR